MLNAQAMAKVGRRKAVSLTTGMVEKIERSKKTIAPMAENQAARQTSWSSSH